MDESNIMNRFILTAVIAVAPLLSSASPLALNYNWNGLVHTGEQDKPNSPDGFRSISDRGLTVATSLNSLPPTVTGNTGLEYSFVTSANTVDTVFLGVRLRWDEDLIST
jgi:hypothetical protein